MKNKVELLKGLGLTEQQSIDFIEEIAKDAYTASLKGTSIDANDCDGIFLLSTPFKTWFKTYNNVKV